ncbi:MAG: aminotransferase class IV [Trueperaceae bacterium]|nr:aminotransferase class IV [Trueperaceae bacterium]
MSRPERIFGFDLELVPASQAALPLTDLTIRRGYGAFDFLRVVEGVPLFLGDHLARFERTAELLGLTPRPSSDRVAKHVGEVIAANQHGTFGLQLFFTGGDPLDGFHPGTPRTLVLVVDLPVYPDAYYRDGVALLPLRFERDLPEAKTTNYFTAVRHARELRAAGAADVLYHDGRLVLETTRCNLFVATDEGALVTPADGVLEGITRMHLLEALDGEIAVATRDVSLDELKHAPEAFLTSTTKGVMPVVRVGDDTVGSGRPGPLARRAAEAFERHRTAWLAAHALDRAAAGPASA